MFVGPAVFVPITIVIIFTTGIYMQVSAKKLYEEMQRKGLLIYGFPIIYNLGCNRGYGSIDATSTGEPTQPANSAESSQRLLSNTDLPPPPSYASLFREPPNIHSM